MKWDLKRFAITGGIVWAVSLFLTTVVSVYTGFAQPFLNGVGSIYPGYSISLVGSVIGFVYGFFDVFIGVYIFAWVYKKLGK
ncbi:MAG: bacteriophage holin [Nitrosotalea sp.]